jgi:amidase
MTGGGQTREECHERAEAIRQSSDDLEDLAKADGIEASAWDYIGWFARRESHRAALRAFFAQWDVLLTPANIVNAFLHTDEPYEERRLDVNGETVRYSRQAFYPSLGNLSGHPATVFPAGLTRSGLPIGLQAVGPYLEDRTPIRFAALVARESGGFRSPPGYDEA